MIKDYRGLTINYYHFKNLFMAYGLQEDLPSRKTRKGKGRVCFQGIVRSQCCIMNNGYLLMKALMQLDMYLGMLHLTQRQVQKREKTFLLETREEKSGLSH